MLQNLFRRKTTPTTNQVYQVRGHLTDLTGGVVFLRSELEGVFLLVPAANSDEATRNAYGCYRSMLESAGHTVAKHTVDGRYQMQLHVLGTTGQGT